MNHNRPSLLLGFLLYGLGVTAGFFLMLVAVWADIEANSYDFLRLANAGLDGLSCPILMTPDETGAIALKVSNPTRNRITPSIKVQISTSLLPEEFQENIELPPGKSARLEWAVDAENIDLGYFIFAKVLLFSASPLPSREATCGILIIDLPVTGRLLVPVLAGVSLLGLSLGLYTINKWSAPRQGLKKLQGLITFLAALIVLGLVLSFTGGWISSLLVFVVVLLLIIILLGLLFAGTPG